MLDHQTTKTPAKQQHKMSFQLKQKLTICGEISAYKAPAGTGYAFLWNQALFSLAFANRRENM
ncbi:hypothetical protein HPB47_018476 [Ixodes persulcatus]|uniref:Uncharacterized protein n=1 Tax=Ixodes persulcatus TaxID=34615 RepID=A0AC60QKT5_IXOPE|nr:hypothetical protein HPB47_018476 [Ixodes persulcatus]